MELSTQKLLRPIGALYLIIAVLGGFAIAYVPSVVIDKSDMAFTMQNISQGILFRLGLTADVLMMLAELVICTLLYTVLAPTSRILTSIAISARLGMVMVMAMMLFFSAGMMWSSSQADADTTALFIHMHTAGVWIWQFFFGFHLALLGVLVLRSGIAPKVIAWLLIIGSLGYILDSVHAFWLPEMGALIWPRNILLGIVTLGELSFALYLLIKGGR